MSQVCNSKTYGVEYLFILKYEIKNKKKESVSRRNVPFFKLGNKDTLRHSNNSGDQTG